MSEQFKKLAGTVTDGRGVTASTATALLVRLAGSAATVVAMPLALHSLGEQRFAAFLLLFGVINWVTLGNFGVHSALGRAIASQEISPGEMPEMLGSALVYAAATTGATAIAVGFCFAAWVRTAGAHLNLPQRELYLAGFVMIALTSAQIVLQTFEGVQIGKLEIYVSNLAKLAGSAFTFLCLLLLPRLWSSILVFVIALNGGVLLGALLNAVLVLRTMGVTFRHVSQNVAHLRKLAVSGLAFLAIGIVSLIQTHVPVLMLATMRGAAAAVDFGLFIRLLFVMMSVLSMITSPLWPAIASARADADLAWIGKTLRVSRFLVMGAGGVFTVSLALFGGRILLLWTGRRLDEPVLFQVLFGIYFLQIAWSHYWATVLLGYGRERFVAGVLMVEGVLILTLGTVFALNRGATGMILGAVCALAAISNWMLPCAARDGAVGGLAEAER